MGDKSNIEWTDATWNPIRGCTRVSKECLNCYAERTAMRFSGKGQPYEGLVKLANGHPQWTGKVRFVEEHLADPLRWHKPRRIFVNSMSDLFHENLDFETIDKVFAVMTISPQHTFQVLTKRPERMLQYMREIQDDDKDMHRWQSEACEISDSPCAAAMVDDAGWPPKNIWLGVSCGNQEAKYRIDLLRETPAAVRMLSLEPLLEDLGQLDLRGIHWVIVRGESGPGARPMHPGWARSIRDQCQAAGVPFFFKQWGEWLPVATPRLGIKVADSFLIKPDGATKSASWSDVMQSSGDIWAVQKVGKKAAGRLLDGREWNEYPQVKQNG